MFGVQIYNRKITMPAVKVKGEKKEAKEVGLAGGGREEMVHVWNSFCTQSSGSRSFSSGRSCIS